MSDTSPNHKRSIVETFALYSQRLLSNPPIGKLIFWGLINLFIIFPLTHFAYPVVLGLFAWMNWGKIRDMADKQEAVNRSQQRATTGAVPTPGFA